MIVTDAELRIVVANRAASSLFRMPPERMTGIVMSTIVPHGNLDVSACQAPPARAEKVLLIPGHCDPTVNLHDWYVGVRGLKGADPRVEALWPVAARGALF